MNQLDRYRGAMLGLAAGDALGTTLEFSPPGSFEPITDMVGGGPFGLEPGQWTDDTSMALCLAESLIESGEFDAVDQLARYVRWKRQGHHSSTGRCFDIGSTVLQAISHFDRTGDPRLAVCAPKEVARDHEHWNLIALLKDADALDRVRLDDLDQRYLRHPEARGMVAFAQALFAHTDGLVATGEAHFRQVWDLCGDLIRQ